MEAAAEARANTTPRKLARQRRALKPTGSSNAAMTESSALKPTVVTEAALRTFYAQHNPANTAPDRLKTVLTHYDGRNDALLRDLSKRYGAAASGAAASGALCTVGQQLYRGENAAPLPASSPRRRGWSPPGWSPVKPPRAAATIMSPHRPRAAPAPLRAPRRRSSAGPAPEDVLPTVPAPELEVPTASLKPEVKAASSTELVETASVRHVPEVSPPKVWPPSINLAERIAQAVKARFFCDASVTATVEMVNAATSPITVPGAATFVATGAATFAATGATGFAATPPRHRRFGVVAAVAVAFVGAALRAGTAPLAKHSKIAAWPEHVVARRGVVFSFPSSSPVRRLRRRRRREWRRSSSGSRRACSRNACERSSAAPSSRL